MKLEEVLELNRKIKFPNSKKKIKIAIISNISVHIFKYFIEYTLKKNGLNAEVHIGGYNNLVQNADKFKNFDVAIIFYEFLNISENIEKIKIKNNITKIKKIFLKDFNLALSILKDCPLILINDFNHFYISPKHKFTNFFEKTCNNLNKIILKKKNNIHVVKINNFFKNFGIKKYIDRNNFQISKTLYNTAFMEEYAEKIKLPILSLNGKSKKALVLDCDNTLWDGIIGENRQANKKKNWKIFKKVQRIYKKLKKNGFILCLCSKNNFKDVSNFFKKKNMPLKFQDFTIKKINWINKVSNIKEISKELNIGLDSLIFVDDSQFEIGAVQKYLKDVDCIKVPSNKNNYLFRLEELENNLLPINRTKEDEIRIKSYDQEKKRVLHKNNFKNIDKYIKSLNIKITYNNNNISIKRASQLCQRTNQFNLTTKRYNEKNIKQFIKDKNILISTISIKDDYGDYGTTGLSIAFINQINKTATIDTFILSCRVLGRGIEKEYLNWIIKTLKKLKIEKIYSTYNKSEKNNIVKDFFNLNKFRIVTSTSNKINYYRNINKFN